jgi:hypothetical protein
VPLSRRYPIRVSRKANQATGIANAPVPKSPNSPGNWSIGICCAFTLINLWIRWMICPRSDGIPDPIKPSNRNWHQILKSIKDENDARVARKAKSWKDQRDKEFFVSAYVSLDAVRVAWRNPTMHIENKYTPDEAGNVFLAVRGFMKKLASRMDENGQPVA